MGFTLADFLPCCYTRKAEAVESDAELSDSSETASEDEASDSEGEEGATAVPRRRRRRKVLVDNDHEAGVAVEGGVETEKETAVRCALRLAVSPQRLTGHTVAWRGFCQLQLSFFISLFTGRYIYRRSGEIRDMFMARSERR